MKRVQGHSGGSMFSVIPLPAFSILPLSSKPRLLMLAVPCTEGVHVKLQFTVPSSSLTVEAGSHVVPPSTDISTPATTAASVAEPVIVIGDLAGKDAPFDGAVMVEVGAIKSVDCVASIRLL